MNVKTLREKFNLSQDELAAKTGIPRDRIAKWEQGKGNPKATDHRILDSFFRELEMEQVPPETKASESKPSYQEQRRTAKLGKKPAIPVYEAAPATLGNIVSYRDEKNGEGDPDFWITIPQLRDCNYGTRAKGDSMHPLIRSNALVIGREIVDMKVIVFGEIYIVHTKTGIETVKYIQPHEQDPKMILLVPYNERAKTTPIHKSDILRLYEAKAVFNTI